MLIKVLFVLAAVFGFFGTYHAVWKQRKIQGFHGFTLVTQIQEYRNLRLAFCFFALAMCSLGVALWIIF